MDIWADKGPLGAVSTEQVGKAGMGVGAGGAESPRAEDLGLRKRFMGAVTQPAFSGALDTEEDRQNRGVRRGSEGDLKKEREWKREAETDTRRRIREGSRDPE